MKYILILLSMVFFHIVDDYYLQAGLLLSLKQKAWWQANHPNEFYKYDYIVALFIHAFSWSFMIMLPLVIYAYVNYLTLEIRFVFWYLINLAVHAFVDDLKANKRKINLIQDQLIHLIQIAVTWVVFVLNII